MMKSLTQLSMELSLFSYLLSSVRTQKDAEQQIRTLVTVKDKFFISLAQNALPKFRLHLAPTKGDEAGRLTQRFLPRVQINASMLEYYLPDVTLAMLAHFEALQTLAHSVQTETQMYTLSLKIIQAGCEAEMIDLPAGLFQNQAELDQKRYYIAFEVPGLLRKIPAKKRDIKSLAKKISALKATGLTSTQIESQILTELGISTTAALQNANAAASSSSSRAPGLQTSQSIEGYKGVLAPNFPHLIKRPWTLPAIEQVLALRKKFFAALEQENADSNSQFQQALKAVAGELTAPEQQYIYKLLYPEHKKTDKPIPLEQCIADAALLILHQYEPSAYGASNFTLQQLAQECIALIKTAYFIKKHVKVDSLISFTTDPNWEARKNEAKKVYFEDIYKNDRDHIKTNAHWTDLSKLEDKLGIKRSQTAAQLAEEQALNDVSWQLLNFPELGKLIGADAELKVLNEMRLKFFAPVSDYSNHHQFKRNLLAKNDLTAIYQALAEKIFPNVDKKEISTHLEKYFFDALLILFSRCQLAESLTPPSNLPETETLCLNIFKAWQFVQDTLRSKKIEAKHHDDYTQPMMALALRLPGSVELIQPFTLENVKAALELVKINPGKNSDDLKKLIQEVGKKSVKELVLREQTLSLRELGIVNLSKSAAINNAFEVYEEYKPLVKTYSEIQQARAGATLSVMKKSAKGRSYTLVYEDESDVTPLPYLAGEIAQAALKTKMILRKIAGKQIDPNTLKTVKDYLFKLYLYYKDKDNLLEYLDFSLGDQFVDEMKRDFIAVEKHKSRFALAIDRYYIPVLLIEHYMPQHAHKANFLHQMDFNGKKELLDALVQALVALRKDVIVKQSARYYAQSLVEYVNNIYPGNAQQLECFKSMCNAIQVLSADNYLLNYDEKNKLYLGLLNDMNQEQLVLGDNPTISDMCQYYNTLLSQGDEIGREVVTRALTEKAAALSQVSPTRYKKIEAKVKQIFKAYENEPAFKINLNNLIAIYAQYCDDNLKVESLEHYATQLFKAGADFDDFYVTLSDAHELISKQLDRKGNSGFAHTSILQRQALLKAQLHLNNFMLVQDISFTQASMPSLAANINQLFEIFDMDRFVNIEDEDEAKVDAEIEVIRHLLARCLSLGKNMTVFMKEICEQLALNTLQVDLGSFKTIWQHDKKNAHLQALLECYLEYAVVIGAIPQAERVGLHYHERLLFAKEYVAQAINSDDALLPRKNELFFAAFHYPDVMKACLPAEIELVLNEINEAFTPYAQEVLFIKLQLMRLVDDSILNIAALQVLYTNKPDDTQADFYQQSLKEQVALHRAGFVLVEESNIPTAAKVRIQKALLAKLQKFVEKSEKSDSALKPEDVSSLYSLCNNVGLPVYQVLAFNDETDRTFSNYDVNNNHYTHENLVGNNAITTEWAKEVDDLNYQRIGYIYDVSGKNVLVDAKKLMENGAKYAQYRPQYLKLVYKIDALVAANTTRSQWHEAYYDVFKTLMPMMSYMYTHSGLGEFHIQLESASDKANGLGVVYTPENIYSLRRDKIKSPLAAMQGTVAVSYKAGPQGYRINFMVQSGNEFYIDYARLTLFYNIFAKYPNYKIILHAEQADEETITAALHKQIDVLKGADHCYLAFNPHTPQIPIETDVLAKLKEVNKDPNGVYCMDNYNGLSSHRRFVESWLTLMNSDVFLFSPVCLKYYAKIFNCTIDKKEDLPYALFQFSRSAVKSDFQNKIFMVMGNYLQGNATEQACLQQIITLKDNDFEGQFLPWFSLCHLRLEELNKHNPLKTEIETLIGPLSDFAEIYADQYLRTYINQIGNDKEKISLTLVNFFAHHPGLEYAKTFFKLQKDTALSKEQLFALMTACAATQAFAGKQKLNAEQMQFIFVQALHYPGLLFDLVQMNKSYSHLEAAHKILNDEFKSVGLSLHRITPGQCAVIEQELLKSLCLNPHYKEEVLTELGLYKRRFTDKPAGLRSRQLRDELLAIHYKYNQALGEFFNSIKTPQIPYETYQHILKVDIATQKFCNTHGITGEAVRDVFLMLLHSLTYYPASKSIAVVMGSETVVTAQAIQQVSSGYAHFMRRHQSFSMKWFEKQLSQLPALKGLTRRDQIALKNRIVELQRLYDDNSVSDEVIENFFRTIASGYVAQVNKYTDLYHLGIFLAKDGKNGLFKTVAKSVLAHNNAQTKHPLLCIFNCIKQNNFLTEKEKQALYAVAVDRYQKYGAGQDSGISGIAQLDTSYHWLLLLNQTELIYKYRKMIGAQFAAKGIHLSKSELETLHQLPVGRIASRSKDTSSMTDQTIFEKLITIFNEKVNLDQLLKVLSTYTVVASEYLKTNNLASSAHLHLVQCDKKVNDYLKTHAPHQSLHRMLFFIALYDDAFFLKDLTKASICERFNALQQLQQFKINPKIMEHGLDKLSQDLRIPFEKIIADPRLKALIDIYCDDELRPVLIQFRKKMPVDHMQQLASIQPYYHAVTAYEHVLDKKAYTSVRKEYFELLLCAPQFEKIVEKMEDISALKARLSELEKFINDHVSHLEISSLDKYYLVYLLWKQNSPITVLSTSHHSERVEDRFEDFIVLGAMHAVRPQVMKQSGDQVIRLRKIAKTVHLSHFDPMTKEALYAAIIDNASKFNETDDLFTICEKAGQKSAFEKAKQTAELQMVTTADIDKRAMQQATLALEDYMDGRRAEFLAQDPELQVIAYARMQWAYFKYPNSVQGVLDCTKNNLDEALAIKLFERIMSADYEVSKFINNVFDLNKGKKLKKLTKQLFEIELAFPGILDSFYANNEDYLRDLNDDALRLDSLCTVVKLIEMLVDLEDPKSLLRAEKQQSDIETILACQMVNDEFYTTAKEILILDKVKPNEEWQKLIPALMSSYAKHPVWVSGVIASNTKYYLENPHACAHHIINVIKRLDEIQHISPLSPYLITLCLNNPMFLDTLSDERAIRQIEHAQSRIKLFMKKFGVEFGQLTPSLLFCCQFTHVDTQDALINRFATLAKDDKQFPNKLTHLKLHLMTLQRSHLNVEEKRKLSEDLLAKFCSASDQFLKYNPELSASVKLASHPYTLCFNMEKTDQFRDPKAVIKFFLNKLNTLKWGANYKGLSFDAVLYPDQAQISDNRLIIPACKVKVDDGFATAIKVTVDHTSIDINAGILYAPKDKLPLYIKEGGSTDPYELTLDVEEKDGKFNVKVSGPSVVCMQTMAILTAYDTFIAQFMARSPGINYLALGSFKAQNVSYFTDLNNDSKVVYHDKAKWRAHNVALFNYNALISKLTNVNDIFRGREKDELLKLNYACRLFNDAVTLHTQGSEELKDSLFVGTGAYIHTLQGVNEASLPVPLQATLAGLMAFNSFTQFQHGLFSGQNLQLIASIFCVGFEMGTDNIATLLTKYRNTHTGMQSEFTVALYQELNGVLRGEIDVQNLFKHLENLSVLPCAHPQEKAALIKQMKVIESNTHKYFTAARMRHYCVILALPYEEDEPLQHLLLRAHSKINYTINQSTFLTALQDFASFRVTPDEFKSIYHRCKRVKTDKNPALSIKSALAQKVKPTLMVQKLTELLAFLNIKLTQEVKDLDGFQDTMHDLLQIKHPFGAELVKKFTVPGELELATLSDFDSHNLNNHAMKNFMTTDPKQHVELKKQINNWLYLYESMQQLALYENEKDVPQIERTLELAHIDYQEREWVLNAVGAAAVLRDADSASSTHRSSSSVTVSLIK